MVMDLNSYGLCSFWPSARTDSMVDEMFANSLVPAFVFVITSGILIVAKLVCACILVTTAGILVVDVCLFVITSGILVAAGLVGVGILVIARRGTR